MRIYVASSWRNEYQQSVVRFLRDLNHQVYDFRNPISDNNGFHWSEIDPAWQTWSAQQYIDGLRHPLAEKGFKFDMEALLNSEACVLVLPSGRSAHLEAGCAAGAGKKLVIYSPIESENIEPELMYKMAERVVTNMRGIQTALFDGHSMGRFLPCDVCGDLDGCHRWDSPNGNQYDSRKYGSVGSLR
jgi:hypothetical protein